MIRAFLVDDERLAIDRLRRLLEQTGRVAIAGTSTDPEEALARLRDTPVDVLFLDVQMPGLTGFDLLERLEAPVPVIFTTAYDEHALRAFATNSVDYLLKPVDRDRLAQAIDKLVRLTQPRRDDLRALARELAAQLAPGRRVERLASKVGGRTVLLDVARISHVVARDKLTLAVVAGREHVVDLTLTQLEAQLDPRRFVRVHRSAVVNTAFVHELHTDVDGGLIVRLRDEAKSEVTVARDRVRDLKDRLGI